jgi:MoaA/NifB/PqqE/SkfB family radical SAM enzyme
VWINREDFSIDYEAFLRDNRAPCFSSRRKPVIDPGGQVYPCALLSYPKERSVPNSEPYDCNIADFPTLRGLWQALAPQRHLLFNNPCSTCYVADRYINNFAQKIAADLRHHISPDGIPYK